MTLSWLANLLVIVGVCLLAMSMVTVRRLMRRMPAGPLRQRWAALSAMIVLFLLGYLVYMGLAWQTHRNWTDLVVPVIFFMGACFVALTARLSLQTAMDLVRVARLEQEACTDPLTGVFNRRYLDRRLAEAVATAKRYKLPMSVLMLDLDHFKAVNDAHGHQVGDQVLAEVGRRLTKGLRDSDVLARYGGEEFLVIATHTDQDLACAVAERLRQCIDRPEFAVQDRAGRPLTVQVSVSIGVATIGQGGGDSAESVVRAADEQLYRAKDAGRNRVSVASPEAVVSAS